MAQILIADDDQAMLQMVEQVLLNEGHEVLASPSAEGVLNIMKKTTPDLFLLDLSMPGISGIELCDRLRKHPDTADSPIIFLTSHNDIHTVVKALEAGGDDYVRKPFAVRELTARIRAHLRRYHAFTTENLTSLRINPDTYQVFVDNKEVSLTRIEFDLLRYLCDDPHKWHATNELLVGVWGYPEGIGDTALVRNHIRNLRRKLETDPDHPDIVQSRHGRGYSIRAKVELMEQAV